MVILLISSVLFLALVAIAIYFWQKPINTSGFRLNQLRPSTEISGAKVDAEAFEDAIQAIKAWQKSPNRQSTAKLLHVAALSDNAKNYGRAIELVLLSWREGSLTDLTAKELQQLINSKYWVLSSLTRISGAGFVLKRTLSNANRELETNKPIQSR